MQSATETGGIQGPALPSQDELPFLTVATGILGKGMKQVIEDVLKYLEQQINGTPTVQKKLPRKRFTSQQWVWWHPWGCPHAGGHGAAHPTLWLEPF
jgi:hypothetical protein